MSQRIDLKAAEGQSGSLEEEKARALIQGIRSDTMLRVYLVVAMVVLFIILNLFVIRLIENALEIDVSMIQDKQIQPADRLVTDNVLMTLIGATVVQLGAVILAIAHYFFPRNKIHSADEVA